jgi:23S rRNA (cytidine1920-2'-O)/16S rRNA (cytidine1409-2'-O)-methyltransferase
MRADQLLVERGLAASRSQAQRLIASGVQWRHPSHTWQRIEKNGALLPPECELQLLDDAESRFVSRGGLKLAGALQATGVTVEGLCCLDIGQSTGGFTDCLLQHGAAQVVGVDVGHAQLHPSLQNDARVVCIEKLNARTLDAADSPLAPHTPLGGFDLLVADLSFISLTLVLPVMPALMQAQAQALLLVKPQFELQPADIGKGGLVKDPASYAQVQQRLQTACVDTGLTVLHWLDSPVAGGDGNREFFIHVRRRMS